MISSGLSVSLFGQVYTNKEVGKKNEALVDSLKHKEWPYSLPIMGRKATARGFNLPYPAGISSQYFWQQSDIIINNLQVGFNNGEMFELDEVVRFDKAVATAGAVTVRPDYWLFPFLNVYGIFGYGAASTDVGFGIWVPDSSNVPTEIISTGSKVEFTAPTVGFGMTPTFGVAGLFVALDMNFTFTDVPQLEKPAKAFVFGPRIGKSFKFKKEDMNIAFWAGGFRVNLSSGTYGSVNLADVLPVDDLGAKIDEGYMKLDDAQQQVDTWWDGLTPAEQARPSNIARHDAANNAISKAGEFLVSAENAVNGISASTVQYSMDKRPADKWNFIVGTQYQINKHWMLRGEAGFLSSRTQFTAGIQYRFGL
ncbi:MAG: hypothetical protein MUC31_06275 [Bacteroidales bacterium]|nr:hypothetical protein [Bacteroidales bacterium]